LINAGVLARSNDLIPPRIESIIDSPALLSLILPLFAEFSLFSMRREDFSSLPVDEPVPHHPTTP
jgi:hypothetical protein